MSGRLYLLVIMIFPAILCLAKPSVVKNSGIITHRSGKRALMEANGMTMATRTTKEGDAGEPERRSIRKTYSKRRINKRWKRYLRYRTVRARPAVKFDVPMNGNLISGVAKTGNIEKGKGRLPWPVSSGTVSMRFGLYEVLKGINHNSIGITIATAPGVPVTAVFGGYVYSIFNIDDKPVVMIRHGKYFTTYSNLAFVSVCKDEPVSTGQILGQVAENGQLDFIISDKSDNYFDPEKWLRK